MTGRKLRKKRARWYTMRCDDTGFIAIGKNAKWRIKDRLARFASYDGKLRFSKIIIVEVI